MKIWIFVFLAMLRQYIEACTVTFAYHGSGLNANLPYWIGSLTLADCQTSCRLDISCGGVSYDTSSSECSKTGRSQAKNARSCTTCLFYHKQCGTDCTLQYTDYFSNEFADPFYATLTVSSFDLCLASCTSDVTCVGVGFNSDLTESQCLLSKNNFPVSVSCKTCRFSTKSCDNHGSVSTIIGHSTTSPTTHNDVTTDDINTSNNEVTSQNIDTSKNDITSQEQKTSKNYVTTEDTNMSPYSFTIYDNTLTNGVTTQDTKTPTNDVTINSNTSPSDVTLHNNNTSVNEGTTQYIYTSSNDVTTQNSTTILKTVKTKDNYAPPKDVTTQKSHTSPFVTTQVTEASSNAFTIQNSNNLPVLGTFSSQSPSADHYTSPTEIKQFLSRDIHNLTTFNQPSLKTKTESSTLMNPNITRSSVSYNALSTSYYVVENPSTLCICHCYEANKINLVEWTSGMRRSLLLSKDILSSHTRKLFSAPDPRLSSFIIGLSGASILAIFGIFFLLFDVSKIVVYIFSKSKHH